MSGGRVLRLSSGLPSADWQSASHHTSPDAAPCRAHLVRAFPRCLLAWHSAGEPFECLQQMQPIRPDLPIHNISDQQKME